MSIKRSVHIQCPTCKTEKNIEVPEDLFEKKKMGLIKVHIEKNICCNHQFIAFFSKSGKNCGYEVLDVAFELEESKIAKVKPITLKKLIDTFGAQNAPIILHAMILDVPILIVKKKVKDEHEVHAYNKFGTAFIPKAYQDESKVSFTIKEEGSYGKGQQYDSLIINSKNNIEVTPWPTLSLEYEEELIKKALDILDDSMQPIIIQEELNSLFKYALFFKETLDKWAAIYEEDIRKELDKTFPDKIDDYLYYVLHQVVERRFKGDMTKIKNPTKPKGRRLR